MPLSPTDRLQTLAPHSLPDAPAACRSLRVAHRRATISLAVRVVSVGFLLALLSARLPAVRRALPVADAGGVALIVWPFYTALGRLYAWRIALGRQFAENARFADAARVLAPLSGVWSSLFDAQGEGRFFLAQAWQAEGRESDARRLWAEVAGQYASTEWGKRAAAETLLQ